MESGHFCVTFQFWLHSSNLVVYQSCYYDLGLNNKIKQIMVLKIQNIEVRYEDENIWLTQKMLGVLFNVETHTINYHIKKIFNDNELLESLTTRKFRIVQNEGDRVIDNNDIINLLEEFKVKISLSKN